jgi:hypothetical protein
MEIIERMKKKIKRKKPLVIKTSPIERPKEIIQQKKKSSSIYEVLSRFLDR